MTYKIRLSEQADVTRLFESFAQHAWHKPVETFRRYLADQQRGVRVCFVAEVDGEVAGYCTLVWESTYEPFKAAGVPEVTDLNVLPPYRNHGVGRQRAIGRGRECCRCP